MTTVSDKLRRDPRCYQVAVLSTLLAYGITSLGFGISWATTAAIFTTAQVTQWAFTRGLGLPRFDPLSALITSLSLTLLLRTDVLLVAAVAAFIAIASKFLVRVNDKHLFNPANLALVVLVLVSDNAWLSGGQWGSTTVSAFFFACLGFLVLTRARRSESTLAFLGAFSLLLVGRALWLGDPLSIPLHQLQNGALLLFAFFMISDPKTTPDRASGRVLHGAFVALVAYLIQFVLYEPHGPIFALVLSAPLVPIIDRLFSGRRYEWLGDRGTGSSLHKGVIT
jgi:Na+-transporting NADH:ubiquinone oxidoreductase subunit NqrB